MTQRDERWQTAARRAEIVGGAASGWRRGVAQCSAQAPAPAPALIPQTLCTLWCRAARAREVTVGCRAAER
eukprot:3537138-Prymnesium_polylepis.1